MRKILPIFSYIFHPLFISVYATLFYFLFAKGFHINTEIYLYLIQVVIITILIPISLFYLLLSLGKVDSLMIENLSQRKIPLMIHALLLFILIKKSITMDRVPELYFFFLGGLISTLITMLFLYFEKKISIHMIGIASLTGFVIGISIMNYTQLIYTIASLVILNGFIASSRLEMKAHTSEELVWGFLCGILPQIILWQFWL